MLDAATRDTVIRTVWGESRGEGEAGWAAVAWVIRNRVERYPGAWWGDSYAAVCTHPWQFSCWKLENAKLLALAADAPRYQAIGAIVDQVFGGFLPDPTGGCCFYKVTGTPSVWGRGLDAKVVIGHHSFYNLGPMD